MFHRHFAESLSAAFSVAITYSICTILVAFWPMKSMKIAAALFHMPSLEQSTLNVTWSNYATGLITLFIFVFVLMWIYTCLYNCYLRK